MLLSSVLVDQWGQVSVRSISESISYVYANLVSYFEEHHDITKKDLQQMQLTYWRTTTWNISPRPEHCSEQASRQRLSHHRRLCTVGNQSDDSKSVLAHGTVAGRVDSTKRCGAKKISFLWCGSEVAVENASRTASGKWIHKERMECTPDDAANWMRRQRWDAC